MTIYPAIDIKGGKCVRLLQGRAEDQTVYGDNPVEMAQKWVNSGAKFLHVVDLDGAFEGQSGNLDTIKELVKAMPVPVQMGGGIRSIEKIEYLLDVVGVYRVIIGTAAVENPDLLKNALKKYDSDRIAVGIDAKNGKVAIKGWVEESDVTAVSLGIQMKDMGIEHVIYTDISRDGMMTGPNIDSTKDMIEKTGLKIIASGGMSTLKDVEDVNSIKAAGVIIGKAIYTGSINLADALKYQEV